MPLLSIVVPIYNAGNRLYKLLDSLCNQTLQNIEYICVLDCPTDGSDRICIEYAKKDKRIIPIFNHFNMGIAYSRNRGIEIAIEHKSTYIGFADHDDYLEYDAYEKMLEIAYILPHGVDVVFANTYIENGQYSKKIYYNDSTWRGIITSLLLPMDFKLNPNYLARSVWHSIYKTSFLSHYNLRFLDRNTYLEEDTLFNLEVYAKTKNIQYLNYFVYHWVIHDTSASRIIGNSKEETEKTLNYLVYEWEILSENKLYEFKGYYYVMVSYFLRRYYSIIQNNEYKHTLAKLLYDSSFPILGKYVELKLFSRVRLSLFWFVLKLKIYYVFNKLTIG